MSDNKKFQKQYLNQLKRISASFDTVLMLLDNRDHESALVITHRILIRLEALFNQISEQNELMKAYVKMALANKMGNFLADKNTLDDWSRQIDQDQFILDENQLRDICHRVDHYLFITKREIMSLFPSVIDWNKRIREIILANEKKIKLGFFLLLGLAIIVSAGTVIYRHQHSLNADYFKGENLDSFIRSKRESSVNHKWGYGAPLRNFPSDNFSVRWRGFLKIPISGTYEFVCQSDDGVVLTVNSVRIIDDWTPHALKSSSGQLYIEKGIVPIQVKYFENSANAEIRLFRIRPGDNEPRIISSWYLLPNQPSPT